MARELFIPIKLTSHDIYSYQQWRSSCLLYFQTYDLSGILDGTETCPPGGPSHPHFQFWYRRDQQCLEWLKCTLSQGLLNRMMVKGSDSSHKLWVNVHDHFANLHHSDIYQFKYFLYDFKKDPTMSINEYLTAIKTLANHLNEAGAPLEDHDIVYHILTGLPDEYNSFCRNVMSHPFLMSSEQVEYWLLEKEKNHHATQPLPPPSAPPADLVAHNSYHQPRLPLPLDAIAHNSNHQPSPPPASDVVAVSAHHQPSPPPPIQEDAHNSHQQPSPAEAADVVAVETHQPSPPPPIQEDAEPAIGIDLGTTFSRVAVWHNDHVEIILNDYGNRKTASFVAFTDADETLVGDAAFNQVVRNTKNTIFDTKRLIGRRFSDSFVKKDVEHWPFKVIEGADDKPMIVVTHNGEEIQHNAEKVSSMILSKMRKIAETFLGSTVKKAVISVPAFFNDEQRCATMRAGAIAGLNVLRIINDPSAAAIAYGILKKADWSSPRNVMIFDLGGGTLDVSLLTMASSGEFQVMATAGDTHLGGEDFDNRMVEHCVEEFKKQHGFDGTKKFRAIRRLKKECEKVKKRLSSEPDYDIEVDCLHEDKDFTINFTREKFEEINLDLFKKCMEPVIKCLEDAKMNITDVDDVILAGGSSRIPKVQELLQEVFKGKELCKGINPDEGVVYGAAAVAALLSGNGKGRFIQDFYLTDVTPFGIYVERTDRFKAPANTIKRNCKIPVRRNIEFATAVDNQDRIPFYIYEGDRKRPESLNLWGECSIDDIPPAPRSDHKFDTCFQIDANGILSVLALDKSTRQMKNITINRETAAGINDDMQE